MIPCNLVEDQSSEQPFTTMFTTSTMKHRHQKNIGINLTDFMVTATMRT
jgi:hypothetical protein